MTLQLDLNLVDEVDDVPLGLLPTAAQPFRFRGKPYRAWIAPTFGRLLVVRPAVRGQCRPSEIRAAYEGYKRAHRAAIEAAYRARWPSARCASAVMKNA